MDSEIVLNFHTINITHPDKILFPQSNITKRQLANYYLAVSETILPYLKNRTITLQRFPDGISQFGFFHKNASDFFPSWLQTVELPKKKGVVHYVVVNKAADILYLVNLNTIAFHVSLSTVPDIYSPDVLVLDLDPDGVEFKDIKWAAKKIKEITDSLGLPLFVKTTGSRGLHLYIPIKDNTHFDEVHDIAKKLANYIATCYPEKLTIQPKKNKRSGKIFIDYIRNSYGQTVVAPYSVRAKEGAPVAAPLNWEELEEQIPSSNHFNIFNIFDRLREKGDIWVNFNDHACSLEAVRRIISLAP